jgi:[ribosomal protein S18]-alanine N-acetyltransferase
MTPDAMAAIHAACFSVPRPWSAEEIAHFISDRHAFVLKEAGGFLIGRVVADEAELLTLAVAPNARRQGIARRLVAAFVDEAQRRGAAQAFLEVEAGNTAAIALYQATGFSESGRRKGYYAVPGSTALDALVLVHPL